MNEANEEDLRPKVNPMSNGQNLFFLCLRVYVCCLCSISRAGTRSKETVQANLHTLETSTPSANDAARTFCERRVHTLAIGNSYKCGALITDSLEKYMPTYANICNNEDEHIPDEAAASLQQRHHLHHAST